MGQSRDSSAPGPRLLHHPAGPLRANIEPSAQLRPWRRVWRTSALTKTRIGTGALRPQLGSSPQARPKPARPLIPHTGDGHEAVWDIEPIHRPARRYLHKGSKRSCRFAGKRGRPSSDAGSIDPVRQGPRTRPRNDAGKRNRDETGFRDRCMPAGNLARTCR